MNKVSEIMMDFVKEYNLDLTTEGICFDARMLIFTKSLFAQVQSEVHITGAGLGQIDRIHILNPRLGIGHFPSEFESGKVNIIFQRKRGLVVTGITKFYGVFKLIIDPLNHDCEEPTLNEIKSKIYN